jgi:hypothetical protein
VCRPKERSYLLRAVSGAHDLTLDQAIAADDQADRREVVRAVVPCAGLHDASGPLAVVFPATGGGGQRRPSTLAAFFVRVYESPSQPPPATTTSDAPPAGLIAAVAAALALAGLGGAMVLRSRRGPDAITEISAICVDPHRGEG